jgi:hypothetical protein
MAEGKTYVKIAASLMGSKQIFGFPSATALTRPHQTLTIVAQKIKHNVAKNMKIKRNLAKTSDPAPDHRWD